MNRIVVGSVYVAVGVALAAVAAWPIYRSGAFVLLVCVCVLVSVAIAGVVHLRRWGGWAAMGLVVAAIGLLGVPLAVPDRWGSADVLTGFGELLAGLVVGWKDLLTVDLPVGDYRNLLVPALVVFLVGTSSALLLAWRRGTVAAAAVPVMIAMVTFGLVFGRDTVSTSVSLGPLSLAAPVETTIGIGSLLAAVFWLSWRTRDRRRRAVRRAVDVSGVMLRRSRERRRTHRTGLSMAMLGAAGLIAVVVVPPAASGVDRTVLRGSTGPDLEVTRTISPLSSYRALFADDVVDLVQFTVTGSALPARVRLAVLDRYDGVDYRTVGTPGSRFERMPSAVQAGPGTAVDATVEVQALTGVWMPVMGEVVDVDFAGPNAADLANGFYVSKGLDAAVQTYGWTSGDGYRMRATVPEAPALAEIAAPGVVPDVELPPALTAWLEEHRRGDDGQALAGLVDLLRERGYLSHALDDGAAAWREDLGEYTFVPSAAGHSLGRVDALFQAMLEREDDPDAVATGNYVSAVGDDEQFAVAVSLLAQALGFPSRIVVGARLDTSDDTLPACEAGACRAGDISAWVEVRAASGAWVPVDVTPQHTVSPTLQRTERREPEIPTEVDPDTVDEVTPPRPSQEDRAGEDPPEIGPDLEWLWSSLRITSLAVGALLLVAGPFLCIIAAKALRRRARRGGVDPRARVTGGWDEYVDAAVDTGMASPGFRTRGEVARVYGGDEAATLAVAADAATFSDRPLDAAEADAYWRIVDAERRRMPTGFWRGVRAAVSLRSFARPAKSRRRNERSSRR